jgi:hypothetical protein
MTQSSSSPPCEPSEGDHDDWATASERSNDGGALGFERRRRETARLLGFGRGGGAAARGALNSPRMRPGEQARGERRRGHGRRVGLGPPARSRCGQRRSERDDTRAPHVRDSGRRRRARGLQWAGSQRWAAARGRLAGLKRPLGRGAGDGLRR